MWIQYIVSCFGDQLFVRMELVARMDFILYCRQNEDEKLKDFVKTIQDVDRVLLHLEYALSKSVRRNHVFEIIGEASPSMWRRWFDVHQFELVTLLNEWPGESTTMLIERC